MTEDCDHHQVLIETMGAELCAVVTCQACGADLTRRQNEEVKEIIQEEAGH